MSFQTKYNQIDDSGKRLMSEDERNKTVKNILDKLIQHKPEYKWDAHCTYADGKGTTILEVLIFSKLGRTINGRISYLVESGDVINFYYKGMQEDNPDSIIDLLLDIFNFEIFPRQLSA